MEGLVALVCFLPFILLSIAATVFWIWAIIDCVRNEPSEGNDKIMWVLIIIFLHVIGAAIYFFVRRPERIEKFGK